MWSVECPNIWTRFSSRSKSLCIGSSVEVLHQTYGRWQCGIAKVETCSNQQPISPRVRAVRGTGKNVCSDDNLLLVIHTFRQQLSLAGHTPNREGKGGLVTSRTTTCAARQDSGATNHLRGFEMRGVEMRGVTSSNARY